MPPVSQKELQIRLTFVADQQNATRAMQQLATEAQKVELAAARANQALAGGRLPGSGSGPFADLMVGDRIAAGRTGPALARELGGPRGTNPAAAASGSSGMLGMLAKIGGPIAAATFLANTAGAVGRAAHDSFLTSEQAERQLFRDIVPFGGTIQKTVDDISGRSAGFERAEVRHQQRMAAVSGRVELAGTMAQLNPELSGHSMAATALNRAKPVLEGYTDRSTAAGEKAFREKQRMLPLERESAKLEREAAAATAQRVSAGAELAKTERRIHDLEKERAKLNKELDSHGSGVERQNILDKKIEVEKEIQGMGGVAKQARMNLFQQTKAEAESRARAGMVGVQKLREQAGILEEDAANSAGTAQRLGGMNRFARANALAALQRLKEFGPDLLSQNEISAAQSLAPREVAKILERSGARTEEAAALKKLAPDDYVGDPEQLRKKAAEKRDEAARKELDLERTLAQSVDAAGRNLGSYLADTIKRLVASAQREIEDNIKKGKNAK